VRFFEHKFISGFQIIFEGILLTLEAKAYTFVTEVFHILSRWYKISIYEACN